MTPLNTIQSERLEPLFEAKVRYNSSQDPVVSAEGRQGELIGNGDGIVTGKKIRGTIRWSFYSGNCAYVYVQAGVEPPPGQHLCTTYPGGVIETDDGGRIWFDAKGFGLRGYDESRPHMWKLTMGIQFSTDDERYQWLNTTLGVLVSDFDESANRALWQIYIPHVDKKS